LIPPPPIQSPFGGTPIFLGGTFEAENFDQGPENIAYHDVDAINQGAAYRGGGVDIQTRTPGGPYVGFVKPGEWLEYSVVVWQGGSYDFYFSAAHLQNGGQFHLELDGQRITPNRAVPRTNSWTAFTEVIQKGVNLPGGEHVLRVAFDTAGGLGYVGNFDYFRFERSPVQSTQEPFHGVPFKPGDRIQAEDFDKGDQNISFFDTTVANEGGAYRNTPVDIQPTTDAGGGYNVGWLKSGEWLEYTIDVPATGNYDFLLRVASDGPSGAFNLSVGDVVQTFSAPDTGGWQNWRDLRAAPMHLTAGTYVLRLQMFGVGRTGFTVNLNWFEFRASA
jgi:hypothetical protein